MTGSGALGGDLPEVLLAKFLAGTVEFEQATRPEQLDPFDGGARADHEAVPHAAGHGLRVEARRAQQPRGQQGPKLRGEGYRPARIRIRRPCQVERLDSQRVPGQQEPAIVWIPAGEGEHAAEPTDRVWPVQAKRAEHDGGVAGGLQLLPLGHQAPAQIDEVVDLAVVDETCPVTGSTIGWVPAGERSRMASRRWASSAPQPRESGAETHVPLASGPRWSMASLIRFSAARLGSSSRPIIPAMPHIDWVPSRKPDDGNACSPCIGQTFRFGLQNSAAAVPGRTLPRHRCALLHRPQIWPCAAGSSPRRRATISRPASQTNSQLVVR